ncbi:MAG TPA: hypothetical protein DCX89_08680 [Saprospirales bacterium]|nr:hypothetical protein [Saprospirales bacterium]HAY71952.1 hypothetical protein [Saprospirales bacterium]HRQ29572.1 SdrD B-like domain-containing protein [Saprospiraceae bacterium]
MAYLCKSSLIGMLLLAFVPFAGACKTIGNVIILQVDDCQGQNASSNDTLFPPAITGRVWRDLNKDGLQQINEPALKAFAVRLNKVSETGQTFLLETLSNSEGMYWFADLHPGSYTVEFVEPPTFNTTIRQAGTDPAFDSDVPVSDPIDLDSGMVAGTIDCGFYVEPPTDCEDDNYPKCEIAANNVLCNIYEMNDFCTNMYPQFANYGPICGQSGSAYQNPSWLAFMATDTTVSLIIHASNCLVQIGEIGVQYAIYTDCTEDEWIVCAALPCTSPGDIYVSSDHFVPGQVYYLVIDGCNATQCTYWVEFIEGIGDEITDPTGISNSLTAGNKICTDVPVEFRLQDCDDAAEYIWTINGVKTGLSAEQTLTLTFYAPGTYELCGQGISPCDTSSVACVSMEVYRDLDISQEYGPICDGDQINISLESNLGMDYDIEVWFEPNPVVTGMKQHYFSGGSGMIHDTLKVTDPDCEIVQVVYLAKLIGDPLTCPGKVDTIRLTIWPNPVIREKTEHVCLNDLPRELSIQLNCGMADDYTFEWTHEGSGNSGNGQQIQLEDSLQPGSHRFYVVSTTPWGCVATGILELNIQSMDTTVVRAGDTLIAMEANAAYQWLNCDAGLAPIAGATQQSFTSLISGSYAVEITKDGCVDTSQCHRLIVSDVIENTIGQGLKVFPNPTEDIIIVELPEVFSFIEVKVNSSDGKEIEKKSFSNTQTLQMSLQAFQQGMYFLNIQTGEKHAMVKVFRL